MARRQRARALRKERLYTRQFLSLGVICLGKSTMPEFGFKTPPLSLKMAYQRETLAPGVFLRRFVWGFCRAGCRRCGALRPRQRRRRFYSDTGCLLRSGGVETHPEAGMWCPEQDPDVAFGI